MHRYCFYESGLTIKIKIPKTITILIIIMLRRQGRFVYVPNVFSVFGAGIYSIYGLLCGCFFDMGESLLIFELLSPFFLCLPFINVPDLISLFSLSLNGWNDRNRKYYSAKHVFGKFWYCHLATGITVISRGGQTDMRSSNPEILISLLSQRFWPAPQSSSMIFTCLHFSIKKMTGSPGQTRPLMWPLKCSHVEKRSASWYYFKYRLVFGGIESVEGTTCWYLEEMGQY